MYAPPVFTFFTFLLLPLTVTTPSLSSSSSSSYRVCLLQLTEYWNGSVLENPLLTVSHNVTENVNCYPVVPVSHNVYEIHARNLPFYLNYPHPLHRWSSHVVPDCCLFLFISRINLSAEKKKKLVFREKKVLIYITYCLSSMYSKIGFD